MSKPQSNAMLVPVEGLHPPLDIADGGVLFKIYDQDGNLMQGRYPDTRSNRMFAVWLRQYDRFSGVRVGGGQ